MCLKYIAAVVCALACACAAPTSVVETDVNDVPASPVGGVIEPSSPAASPAVDRVLTPKPPVLLPGDGFSGDTSPPASPTVGKSPGADAQAIARWDVVPHQTIKDELIVGVVAFHMNGIDRVEFSVQGGPWTPVRSMTSNPHTGVAEYCAALRIETFKTDGPIELRAIAYPTDGLPRLLESLPLNVNRNGTHPQLHRYVSPTGDDALGDGSEKRPFATIYRAALSIQDESGIQCADNGVIYLTAGDHAFGPDEKSKPSSNRPGIKTRDAFLTIRAAPGLSGKQVRITAGGRIDASLVHIQGLTIHGAKLSSSRKTDALIWFDDCQLTARDKNDDVSFASRSQWTGGVYVTDCEIRDVRNGLSGTQLLRNVSVSNTLSDAMSNCRLVINCTVDGIDKGKTDEHPDVLQWYIKSPLDNVIIYGLTARNAGAQGIFVSGDAPVTNVAFVNVLIEMANHSYLNQWRCSADHLLFWNISLVNRPLVFRHENIRNLSIRDSVFFELRGIDFRKFPKAASNNHFIQGGGLGAKFTLGDPGWTNAEKSDYEPALDSPLRGRVGSPLVPRDATGTLLRPPASLGAIQPKQSRQEPSDQPMQSSAPVLNNLP